MEPQLPGRKKPNNTDFDTSETAVKTWVADLPVINIEKTQAMLRDALEQINMLDISPAERYAAIELIATPVLYVTNALKKEFLGKRIPLKDQHLSKAQQCLDLYDRMATAYEIMAADLGRSPGRKPRLATSLHRAMRYLGESLLTNYQIYLQYPEGVWKSIHTLYTAAEKEGRTIRKVTDKTLSTPHESTIESVYKQILLLSLSCPYRMSQKEIHYVQKALHDLSAACSLTTAAQGNDGLFSVNLLSDDAPSYETLKRGDGEQNHEYWRTLDTSKMAAFLRKDAAEVIGSSGVHKGSIEGETLKRLMLAWGVMPKRRFNRHQAVTDVELIVGLDAIHKLLETPHNPPAHTAAFVSPKEQLEPVMTDPTFETITRFRAHPVTGTTRNMSAENHAVANSDAESNAAQTRVEAWKISDMSAGGFCLLADSHEPSCARVGELIAIRTREASGRQNWQLGVSRRIKFTRERGLELGLQMLSPGARPVWTGICRDGTTPTTRMKGILLPEIESLKQASSLLLPSLPFHVGSTSVLEYAGQRDTITLTRQLENTGIFGQYHFTGTESA